jgi:hypothetical protein
LTDFLFDALN